MTLARAREHAAEVVVFAVLCGLWLLLMTFLQGAFSLPPLR
jgi:hypothetical protein